MEETPKETSPAPSPVPIQITILSKDQIAALDKDVGKEYVFLEERISTSALLKLNPIITELIELKELANIKYDTTSQETIDASIESYKTAKARLRSFAGKLAEVKKEIKGPIDEAGKKIVSIEKSCLKIKDKVVEDIEKEFDVYEKDKKEKADQAIEKRDAVKNDTITELSENNAEQLATIKKGNLIQKLKFESSEAIGDEVATALTNFTKDKIDELIVNLQTQYVWANIVYGNDVTILSIEELEECKKRFESQINLFIGSLQARSSALALTNTVQVQQAATEMARTGMAGISTSQPNYSSAEENVVQLAPSHTTPVPQPVPVPIPTPVPVQPIPYELLNGIEAYRNVIIDQHQNNVNTMRLLYNNYSRNISIHSSTEEINMQRNIHGCMQMAERALEWVQSKFTV